MGPAHREHVQWIQVLMAVINSVTIIITVRIINVESDAAPTVSWWSTHHYCV